jgi:hypothetical protein
LASSIGDYLEEGDEAFLLSFDDEDSFWNATTGYYDGEAELAFSLSSDNEDLHHEASLPLNFFPGRPPGTHPTPVYSAPSHLFDSFATVTTSNALVPSQVQFSNLKGATIGIGVDVSVADKNVSVVVDSSIYTAVSVLAADEDSDNDVSEAFVLADKTVSDGIYTGIGSWTCFEPFNTKPEEEIIFESQDSEDSPPALQYHALPTHTTATLPAGLPRWRFHQPVHCAYIRCRRSSLRWVTALIYKLLLIAWDLWTFKTGY